VRLGEDDRDLGQPAGPKQGEGADQHAFAVLECAFPILVGLHDAAP
jgi:hypothetical protein